MTKRSKTSKSYLSFLSAILLSASAHGTLVDGLVNYWPLDGDGTDAAHGLAGSASTVEDNGTVAGANGTDGISFVDGLFGQATLQNGAGGGAAGAENDGHISINASADTQFGGEDLTISMWVQVSGFDTGWQAAIAHGEGTNYRIARRASISEAGYAGGVGEGPESGIDISVGWHHLVAITEQNVGTRLYIDGLLASTVNNTATSINNQSDLFLNIGANPATGANNREWAGNIDDVAQWNRALDESEIATIYGGGPTTASSIGDLVAIPDFDDDGLSNEDEVSVYGTDPNDPDSDQDGLGDGDEVFYGLDPLSAAGDDGAAGDPDGDTLTNFDEINTYSTDPTKEDTDSDTLSDADEVLVHLSNPLLQDTDFDSLSDADEVNLHLTNPTKADSDDDSLPDDYEVANALNPNFNDTLLDPDSDALTNLDEFGRGTDPQKADTDDDFSNDGDEVNNGTNPLFADTDGDGLLDGHETNKGGDSYTSPTDAGTDPLVGDSDNDGTSDGREVLIGRNPTVADPQVVETLEDGLLAYWNFDNTLEDVAHSQGIGDSAVADDGTFSGGGAGTDVIFTTEEESLFGSSALRMNGGDGWVTVPASIDTRRQIENAISVSAWVKLNAWDVSWQAIMAHGEGNQWRLARHGTNDSASWVGGSADIFGSGEIIPGDQTWHHVVGVADPVNGLSSLYIDGSLVATGGAPAIDDRRNGDGSYPALFIGNNSQAGNREWNGDIDEVAIWGRALSESEIAQIYNGGDGESILNLVGGSRPPTITSFTYDPSVGENGSFSLTFDSRSGGQYSIWGSLDLNDGFPVEVESLVTGEDGSTTVLIPRPATNAPLFYRIEAPRQ